MCKIFCQGLSLISSPGKPTSGKLVFHHFVDVSWKSALATSCYWSNHRHQSCPGISASNPYLKILRCGLSMSHLVCQIHRMSLEPMGAKYLIWLNTHTHFASYGSWMSLVAGEIRDLYQFPHQETPWLVEHVFEMFWGCCVLRISCPFAHGYVGRRFDEGG